MIENGSIQAIKTLRVHSLKVSNWDISQGGDLLKRFSQASGKFISPAFSISTWVSSLIARRQLHTRYLGASFSQSELSAGCQPEYHCLHKEENNITSLKALRKCTLPSLRELNLCFCTIIQTKTTSLISVPFRNWRLLSWSASGLHLRCISVSLSDCFVAQQASSWIFKLPMPLPTRLRSWLYTKWSCIQGAKIWTSMLWRRWRKPYSPRWS